MDIKIKIMIATHKKYKMPREDIYLPIHVGKEEKRLEIGYLADNTGDNISKKNSNYAELTALYWAWKNLKSDYVGLVHYRRHFSQKKKGGKWESVLSKSEAMELCEKYDVIVPNKRRYYIETNYSHYIHAHKREGLDMAIEIIKNDYPEYVVACDAVMNRTWAHMFNMFIMKRKILDEYCEWLFDILFKAEEKLDLSDYSADESRVFGFASELLLDVWLETNGVKYRECKVVFMEKQNWIIKGGKFLARKILGERNIE
jgi:hypothetical protein